MKKKSTNPHQVDLFKLRRLLANKTEWSERGRISNRVGSGLLTLSNFLLAAVAAWYAYQGNVLTRQSNVFSQTALRLAVNDTSQQAQINRLQGILLEIKLQNGLTQKQNDELLSIGKKANELNESSNQLLSSSNIQTGVMTEQLSLSTKYDSLNTVSNKLSNENDLYLFRKIQSQFNDLDMLKRIGSFRNYETADEGAVKEIRSILESAFSNRLFLTDTIIKKAWYGYYKQTLALEEHIKAHHLGKRATPERTKEIMKKIYIDYAEGFNRMSKAVGRRVFDLIKNDEILRPW